MKADIIIPAYNESKILRTTLASLHHQYWVQSIIVVDDGSSDDTAAIAREYTTKVITHPENRGKREAVITGLLSSETEWIVLLDADLGVSAIEGEKLLLELKKTGADMTIALFPEQEKKGFGMVKKRAQHIVQRETGCLLTAPLSGQRAFHRKWIPEIISQKAHGFGLELQLNLTFLTKGAKVIEVPTNMEHRATGKDLRGLYHRAKQWVEMERTLWNFQ